MEATGRDLCTEIEATSRKLVEQIVKSNEELRLAISQSQSNIDDGIKQIIWRMWMLLGSSSLVCIISIQYSAFTPNVY